MNYEIFTHSNDETIMLGTKLATLLPSGAVLCLTGDLGAGKTTLVRGLAQGLNIKDVVQSPTFNIMKIYLKGNKPLIHIDAYRLKDLDHNIGLDEYIGYETGITVIEWPMYIPELLPNDVIEVNITRTGDNDRKIVISTNDDIFGGAL